MSQWSHLYTSILLSKEKKAMRKIAKSQAFPSSTRVSTLSQPRATMVATRSHSVECSYHDSGAMKVHKGVLYSYAKLVLQEYMQTYSLASLSLFSRAVR